MAVHGKKLDIILLAHFDRVTMFDEVANFHWGWGSYVLVKMSSTHVYAACMSPTLNGSSVIQCFKCGNVIEMFGFYQGLPLIYIYIFSTSPCFCGNR